jgi:CheY-like chemotaxis protein
MTGVVRHAVRPIEVLLVESQPAEVVVIKESFVAAKIINNVRVVESGEQAVEYLRRRGPFAAAVQPDLMLLNWWLPEMSGLELLALMRADAQLASLPVAMLSTSEDPRDVERAQALQANWFISKPIDGEHLMRIVRASAGLWMCIVTSPDGASMRRDWQHATC